MRTPVSLKNTLVRQNIAQVSLNRTAVSLRLALNGGNGNTIQLKVYNQQSTPGLCILPACELWPIFARYCSLHFIFFLQLHFSPLSAVWTPQSLFHTDRHTTPSPPANLLCLLEQLLKMIEDSKFFFEKFQRLSEDQGNVSDESLNFFD